ncbi:MAG: hypothetical protein SVR04_02510 [Spirochaetota bacterium]|nr:hypothetical protein [Spirochaetota bacterium]
MNVSSICNWLQDNMAIDRNFTVESKSLELSESLPADDVVEYLNFLKTKASGKNNPSGWFIHVMNSPSLIGEFQNQRQRHEPADPEFCLICGSYFYGSWCHRCGHEIGEDAARIEMRRQEYQLEQRDPAKYHRWAEKKRREFFETINRKRGTHVENETTGNVEQAAG